MWQLMLASSLVAVAQAAFGPANIRVGFAENSALAPKAFMNRALVPQDLTILDRPGISSDMIPQFVVKPDQTITWNGWCMEALGSKVRVNHCTGGAAQKWNWIPNGQGQDMIQLSDTNKCIDASGSFDGMPVELKECRDIMSETWIFGKRGPSHLSLSSPVQQMMISLFALAGVGALTLSAVFWRSRREALAVACARTRMAACMDEAVTAKLFQTSPSRRQRTGSIAMQLLGGGDFGGGGGGGGLIIPGSGGGAAPSRLAGIDRETSGSGFAPKLIVPGGASEAPGWGGSNRIVGGGGSNTLEMPGDLANFDPSHDPLAAERPKYDFVGASGRPEEMVWGAVAPASAAEIEEWVDHIRSHGVQRVLGLFTVEDAADRSPDGTAAGYMGALVSAGLDPNDVGLLDPRAPGSRDIVLGMCRDSYAKKSKLCIHCADGTTLTSVALADWLLTDYIGGDNAEEACDLLAARKRLSGVGRKTAPEQLQTWIEQGKLERVDAAYAKKLVDEWMAWRAAMNDRSGHIEAPF